MSAMSPNDNASFMLDLLRAIEERRLDDVPGFYHPEIEFHWPPGLPYGGSHRGAQVADMAARFAAVWGPLQPTEEIRRMEPKVVAVSDDGRVVVNYLWKGLDAQGRRFETEILADYHVRDGRLARAQMFHFDQAGLIRFLERAGVASPEPAHSPGDR